MGLPARQRKGKKFKAIFMRFNCAKMKAYTVAVAVTVVLRPFLCLAINHESKPYTCFSEFLRQAGIPYWFLDTHTDSHTVT